MFLGPHKMKMSHYFSVFDTLWNLGLFWFPKTPPPNFELFPTETWDFFDFLTTPPLIGPFPKFPRFLDWKASLTDFFFTNTDNYIEATDFHLHHSSNSNGKNIFDSSDLSDLSQYRRFWKLWNTYNCLWYSVNQMHVSLQTL